MGQYLLGLVAALTVGAIVFAVAAMVTGADPGLGEVEPDGRAVPLPTDRPLTEADVVAARFDTAARGYRMAQVDVALARVAYDTGYKDEMIGVLEAEVAALREGRTAEADALRDAREAARRGIAGASLGGWGSAAASAGAVSEVAASAGAVSEGAASEKAAPEGAVSERAESEKAESEKAESESAGSEGADRAGDTSGPAAPDAGTGGGQPSRGTPAPAVPAAPTGAAPGVGAATHGPPSERASAGRRAAVPAALAGGPPPWPSPPGPPGAGRQGDRARPPGSPPLPEGATRLGADAPADAGTDRRGRGSGGDSHPRTGGDPAGGTGPGPA